MNDIQIDDDRDNEIVTFIGILRKWANLTLKIYSFLFLGYAVWIVFQRFRDATKTLEEKLGAIFAHLTTASVVEAITIVAIIQVVDVFMYLTNKFKTKVKKQVEEAEAKGRAEGEAKGRTEGEAKGRTEGEAKGRLENYEVWAAWNARRIAAESKGLPFDEPPPEPPENVQDTESNLEN